MSLDWRTDEEDDWAVEPGEGQTPRPRPTRPGRSLLLLFLLFALAAGVIYWQVARLVAQTAADTEQDVIAAAELVRFAASSGDVELFTTLLSGRDPQWTVTQQQLVGAGHLLQRQAFDLQPQLSQTAAMTVSLAPDFRSAQLWTQQPYTLTLPNGQQSQIILVQESHFRRGNSRWLYAPPPKITGGPGSPTAAASSTSSIRSETRPLPAACWPIWMRWFPPSARFIRMCPARPGGGQPCAWTPTRPPWRCWVGQLTRCKARACSIYPPPRSLVSRRTKRVTRRCGAAMARLWPRTLLAGR